MRRITALVTAFVFASSSAIAEELPGKAKCSDASLAGNYRTLVTGTYGNVSGDTPVNFAVTGLMNFNGDGTIEEFIYNSSLGGTLFSATASGTYSIDAKCVGALNVAGITASIVVTGSGFTGLVTVSNGWVGTVTGTK